MKNQLSPTQQIEEVSNIATELKDMPATNPEECEADIVKKNLLYSILDAPPFSQCTLLGLQHFITMMSGTAILPTLLFNSLCITNLSDRSAVISSTFFVMGLATLLQTLLGTRLPIIQGASFTFLIPVFAILSSDTLPSCPPLTSLPENISNADRLQTSNSTAGQSEVWMERISFISGTLAVSSVFQVLMGATGLTSVMVRHIGPLVIAPTICLIGLSLVPVAAAAASKNWYIALLVCALVILFSYILDWVAVPLPTVRQRRLRLKRFPLFKSFPVLLSVGFTWALCGILTASGALTDNPRDWSYAARTDIGSKAFSEAAWIRIPYPGQFGRPRILAVGILGMVAAVILSVVESIGDYVAAAKLSGAPRPPPHAINRGVIMEGLACILAGLFGLPTGTTSYSENIGAIGITRVGCRRVIMFSAAFMLIFGISPKSGAVFVSLPEPVIGGLFLAMFGMVIGVGLSNLQFANMNDQRNVFIVGYSIIIGLAVPHWLRSPGSIDGLSAANEILVGKEGAVRIILETVFTLLKNEIFVTGLSAFVLDNFLKGTPSDRGLAGSASSSQSAACRRRDLAYYDLPFGQRLLGRWPRLRLLPFLPDYRGIDGELA